MLHLALSNWHFPSVPERAEVLAALNPDLEDPDEEDLEDTQAWECANAITEANDVRRNYAAAWRRVAAALAYRLPRTPV